MVGLILLYMGILGPVPTSQFDPRFSLICDGTISGAPVPIGTVSPPAFHLTIHLDLASMRYCEDECRTVQPISRRDGDSIIFKDRPSDGYHLVDRASWSPSTGYVADFAATYRAYVETRTEAACRQTRLLIDPRRLSTR